MFCYNGEAAIHGGSKDIFLSSESIAYHVKAIDPYIETQLQQQILD
jgi:hypothetical protein